MDEATAVDGLSGIFLVLEVTHEIVTTAATNLTISLGIRLID